MVEENHTIVKKRSVEPLVSILGVCVGIGAVGLVLYFWSKHKHNTPKKPSNEKSKVETSITPSLSERCASIPISCDEKKSLHEDHLELIEPLGASKPILGQNVTQRIIPSSLEQVKPSSTSADKPSIVGKETTNFLSSTIGVRKPVLDQQPEAQITAQSEESIEPRLVHPATSDQKATHTVNLDGSLKPDNAKKHIVPIPSRNPETNSNDSINSPPTNETMRSLKTESEFGPMPMLASLPQEACVRSISVSSANIENIADLAGEYIITSESEVTEQTPPPEPWKGDIDDHDNSLENRKEEIEIIGKEAISSSDTLAILPNVADSKESCDNSRLESSAGTRGASKSEGKCLPQSPENHGENTEVTKSENNSKISFESDGLITSSPVVKPEIRPGEEVLKRNICNQSNIKDPGIPKSRKKTCKRLGSRLLAPSQRSLFSSVEKGDSIVESKVANELVIPEKKKVFAQEIVTPKARLNNLAASKQGIVKNQYTLSEFQKRDLKVHSKDHKDPIQSSGHLQSLAPNRRSPHKPNQTSRNYYRENTRKEPHGGNSWRRPSNSSRTGVEYSSQYGYSVRHNVPSYDHTRPWERNNSHRQYWETSQEIDTNNRGGQTRRSDLTNNNRKRFPGFHPWTFNAGERASQIPGGPNWHASPGRQKRRRLEPLCVFDIDGTLADMTARLNLAPGVRGQRCAEDWDIILDGKNYYLDVVIPESVHFVKFCARTTKICYLSGRRAGTESYTGLWLKANGFPDGLIIHRKIGQRADRFKQEALWNLKQQYFVKFHVGDRIVDDCFRCLQAGIRSILVVPNKWVSREQADGGLRKVISDTVGPLDSHEPITIHSYGGRIETLSPLIIAYLKRSKWFKTSYPRGMVVLGPF